MSTFYRLEIEERQSKLEQLKAVLEMYGHFSGINRKVQFKYQPHGQPRHSSSEEGKDTTRHYSWIWEFQMGFILHAIADVTETGPNYIELLKHKNKLSTTELCLPE